MLSVCHGGPGADARRSAYGAIALSILRSLSLARRADFVLASTRVNTTRVVRTRRYYIAHALQ